jgi:hypothetical protein
MHIWYRFGPDRDLRWLCYRVAGCRAIELNTLTTAVTRHDTPIHPSWKFGSLHKLRLAYALRYQVRSATFATNDSPIHFRRSSIGRDMYEDTKQEDCPGMVGSIMYAATITRPGIVCTSGLLTQTASKWNKTHVHPARPLLRYRKW